MNKTELIILLKLSIQKALLAEVTENLFAVTVGAKERTVNIIAYFKKEPDESDIEHIQFVGTEVAADLPSDYMVEEKCLSLERHKQEMLDFWAFERASE